MAEGLILNYGVHGGSFENIIKGWLFKDLREGEGPLGNFAPPSSTSRWGKTEEGAMGRRRPWARGPGGMAAAGDRGKRGRATPGSHSPPRFVWWRPVETAAGMRDGGTAGLGGGRG